MSTFTPKKFDVSLIVDMLNVMAVFYRPTIQGAVKAEGLPEQWGLLWYILEYGTVTVEKLRHSSPYSAPARYLKNLGALMDAGLLTRSDTGEYALSDKGRKKLMVVIHGLNDFLAAADLLPDDEETRLAELLWKVLDTSLNAKEPELKVTVNRNRNSDPGMDAPALVRIVQYFTDLWAFRDDCHLAAWRSHDVEGHAWEAFTFIWNDDAHSAEELAEKLEFRGYTADDYVAALKSLEVKGWIEGKEGTYQLTETGKKLRQAVEDETDRMYFTSWKVLTDEEQDELLKLLEHLKQAASAKTATPEAEAAYT